MCVCLSVCMLVCLCVCVCECREGVCLVCVWCMSMCVCVCLSWVCGYDFGFVVCLSIDCLRIACGSLYVRAFVCARSCSAPMLTWCFFHLHLDNFCLWTPRRGNRYLQQKMVFPRGLTSPLVCSPNTGLSHACICVYVKCTRVCDVCMPSTAHSRRVTRHDGKWTKPRARLNRDCWVQNPER